MRPANTTADAAKAVKNVLERVYPVKNSTTMQAMKNIACPSPNPVLILLAKSSLISSATGARYIIPSNTEVKVPAARTDNSGCICHYGLVKVLDASRTPIN